MCTVLLDSGMLRRWLVAWAAIALVPVEGMAADVPMPSSSMEPILAHAEVDLKALRRARTATTGAVVALPAAHIGHLAMPPLLEQNDETKPELIPTAGLLTVSSVAMLVLPTVIDVHAHRSRRSIEAQGVSVRRTSRPVVTALLSAVPLVVWAVPRAGEDPEPGRVALAYGAYAGVLALPLAQLVQNRRARVRAGWVGTP